MLLNLGEKIKSLRKINDCTQDKLAQILGVTAQAVSKWESNFCYPDIEFMPVIANYFGITIDELFGYDRSRNIKIDNILNEICINESKEVFVSDETLNMVENAAEEFPNSERIILKLAEILTRYGWQTHKESILRGNNGYYINDTSYNENCPEWKRAIDILEELKLTSGNSEIIDNVSHQLIVLYHVTGDYNKAKLIAESRPSIISSKEFLLSEATDDIENAKYRGELLIKLAHEFSENLMTQITRNMKIHDDPQYMIDKIDGIINLYYTIFDGEFDFEHEEISYLYLYQSTWFWRAGMNDKTFEMLDKSLYHMREFDKLFNVGENKLKSAILSEVKTIGHNCKLTPGLPEAFPMWLLPHDEKIINEIKSDDRWNNWVIKTKS